MASKAPLLTPLDTPPCWADAGNSETLPSRRQEIEDCRAARAGGDRGQGAAGQIAVQLLAGVLLWLVTLSLAVGFATFAFLQIPEQTPLAISMQILGSAVAYLWLGARSRNPSSCVQASPIPSIYISVFVEAAKELRLAPAAQISTVLLFVWLTTLTQGVAFVVCSRYSMGDVLQYFPRSVIMGYNGGIGLLICNAAISMLSGVNPLEGMHAFLQARPVLLTLPGVLVGVVVYVLSLNHRLAASPTFKVAPIISVILAFYVVLRCSGVSLEEARDMGWVFPDTGWMNPMDVVRTFRLSTVDWHLLQNEALPLLPPMTLISMVAQYASLGAILLQTVGSTKDADDETRHLGCASVVSGLVGAMPNLSGMAPASLLLGVVGKGGARGSCLVVCGALHLLLFVSGFPLVAFIPKCSIAGCLLMPISFKMIRGALFESLATSTWSDFVIVWVVSWTTLLANIQWGLVSGFLFTVFRLLYEYAHFDIVSRRESIKDVCTLKERTRQVQQVLFRYGDEVLSFRLKGVLFFANFVGFKLELQQLLEDTEGFPPKFIVVDFTEVVYADSSVWDVLANFSAQAQAVAASEVILCALSPALVQDLSRQGAELRSNLKVDHLQHEYLHTLEQLEDEILSIASADSVDSPQFGAPQDWAGLADFVASGILQDKQKVEDRAELEAKLRQYFSEASFQQGQMVQMQDGAVGSFFFVCSGEFHVFSTKSVASKRAPVRSGTPCRQPSPLLGQPRAMTASLSGNCEGPPCKRSSTEQVGKAYLHRKLMAGFVDGVEMFCHEEKSRSMEAYTSVQCRTSGSLLRLSREGWQRMRQQDPELCVALLLSVSSRREVLRRRHVLNGFEPEEVEVVEGIRRKFTMPFRAGDLELECRKNRFNLVEAAVSLVNGIRLRAIDAHSEKHSRTLGSSANITDMSGRALA